MYEYVIGLAYVLFTGGWYSRYHYLLTIHSTFYWKRVMPVHSSDNELPSIRWWTCWPRV